ncbi:MAG: hypothetical protein ACE148_14480 [Vicinamibacterales bacterium]
MKVQATKLGIYGLMRRRVGDVFTLRDHQDFSPTWMERVPDGTPERTTTGQQAIDRVIEERLGRHTGRRFETPDDNSEGRAVTSDDLED